MKMLTSCFFCILLLLSHSVWGLTSPFHSSVQGIDIPNAHEIVPGLILRGMEPRSAEDFNQLREYGIKKVLIFKKTVGNEIEKEIQGLLSVGFLPETIKHIQFPWKDLDSFTDECLKTVSAFNFLLEAEKENAPIYFHCTVGEDRTGYLAGIYRMAKQSWDLQKAFEDEMCVNGYEAGNPQKPQRQVVDKIRKELTPLFVKMAFLINQNKGELKKSDCSNDPETNEIYLREWSELSKSLKCKNSPRYPFRRSN